jgi:hypothetical protein
MLLLVLLLPLLLLFLHCSATWLVRVASDSVHYSSLSVPRQLVGSAKNSRVPGAQFFADAVSLLDCRHVEFAICRHNFNHNMR